MGTSLLPSRSRDDEDKEEEEAEAAEAVEGAGGIGTTAAAAAAGASAAVHGPRMPRSQSDDALFAKALPAAQHLPRAPPQAVVATPSNGTQHADGDSADADATPARSSLGSSRISDAAVVGTPALLRTPSRAAVAGPAASTLAGEAAGHCQQPMQLLPTPLLPTPLRPTPRLPTPASCVQPSPLLTPPVQAAAAPNHGAPSLAAQPLSSPPAVGGVSRSSVPGGGGGGGEGARPPPGLRRAAHSSVVNEECAIA